MSYDEVMKKYPIMFNLGEASFLDFPPGHSIAGRKGKKKMVSRHCRPPLPPGNEGTASMRTRQVHHGRWKAEQTSGELSVRQLRLGSYVQGRRSRYLALFRTHEKYIRSGRWRRPTSTPLTTALDGYECQDISGSRCQAR